MIQTSPLPDGRLGAPSPALSAAARQSILDRLYQKLLAEPPADPDPTPDDAQKEAAGSSPAAEEGR